MPPVQCISCKSAPASMKRPKNGDALCRPCFYNAVEHDTHQTITKNKLFSPGDIIACGASGGKDSTVMMHLLKKLNERHNYGVTLVLVSVDEGITGYRDESLVTVKRNSKFYGLPLTIVSYEEHFDGWSMDKIVAKIGTKNNCSYCGVLRRQALEKGARIAGATKIATGHNADDTAETVLMNLLRSDMPRLERCANPMTNEIGDDDVPLPAAAGGSDGGASSRQQQLLARASIPRVKPMRDLYEKEIVLYAHFQGLDYFSTECTYSKEAFRGNARTLLKQLEAISPRCIASILSSAEELFVPAGAGSQQQKQKQIAVPPPSTGDDDDGGKNKKIHLSAVGLAALSSAERHQTKQHQHQQHDAMSMKSLGGMSSATSLSSVQPQVAQRCRRCGSLSSRQLCRACVLVESLNGTGPKLAVGS